MARKSQKNDSTRSDVLENNVFEVFLSFICFTFTKDINFLFKYFNLNRDIHVYKSPKSYFFLFFVMNTEEQQGHSQRQQEAT